MLSLLIAHLVEILMLLCSLADEISKLVKGTTRTRSTLTLRNGSGRRVGDEPHVLPRPGVSVSIDGATAVTSHFLHADVAEEGDEVRHAPGAGPIDVVGRELLSSIG